MKPLIAAIAVLFWIGCSCEAKRGAKSAPEAGSAEPQAAAESPEPDAPKAAAKKTAPSGGDIRDKLIPGYEKLRKDTR